MIPYKLSFDKISEVRMGSPFNKANVVLVGSYIPSMLGYEFQDVGLVCKNGTTCALVQWDIQANEPRFRVWILNQKKERTVISQPLDGACISLEELNEDIVVKVWSFNSSSKKGVLRELTLSMDL